MHCAHCGHDNPVGTKFCAECGAGLTVVCAACGTSNPARNKFCGECGSLLSQSSTLRSPTVSRFASPQAYTPHHLAERILSSRGALEGERKQVTVLFADLKGSMELLAERDPEDARALLDPVLERMIEAVHHYEGTVNQVMGDGIMALFGAPLAHEDHAVRACYAALRIRDTVGRHTEEARRAHGVAIHIRIGLNSGEVVVRSIGSDLHMDYTAVGQTTHLAARMEQMAMPGSILLAPETLRLAEGFVQVEPLGAMNVKGLSEPVHVYELSGTASARSRFQVAAGRGLTRFVGRDAEMVQLHQALERAGRGQGQVVALVGEPGVGKSRLVWEFIHSHRAAGWLILESGSVSYGKATPYLPVIDLVKAYCKIEDRDDLRAVREKVTGKLLTLDRALEPLLPPFFALFDVPVEDDRWQGLDPQQRRDRTLDAVKRLLIRESQAQPLLIVFEDLHWIDTETQALLDGLVESLPTARMLLLVNYRPEYQHRWGNKTYYTQLRLDPLPPESAAEFLNVLVGADETLASLKTLLIERTEGNPFFLEEGVRTLTETQALAGERGAYRLDRPLSSIQVPPTVQAMLAARIDRLAPDEKRLLQCASVIGKDVPFIILQAIAEMPDGALQEGLARLQAAEFMYETSIFPDREYTFKHALTHEVAYQSLLQERRREIHRRTGEALEQLFAERLEEFSPLPARHFYECGDLRKALTYAMQAAEKTERLFAHEEALRHYERARVCAERLNLADRLVAIDEGIGDVYSSWGLLDRAVESYERATASAGDPDTRAGLKFKIGKVYGRFGDQRGLQSLEAALAELNPSTQQRERAEATAYLGRYQHYGGQHGRAIELLEEALRLAVPLDDAQTLKTIYSFLAGAYEHMVRPAQSMEWARRCVDLGERAHDLFGVATGFEFLAENLFILGRWTESLDLSSREYSIAKQIGSEVHLTWVENNRAIAFHGKGDLTAAAAAARAGLVLAERSGEKRIAALLTARLAEVETDLGSDEPANGYAEAGVASADALGDRVVRAMTRHARIYCLLQRGEWQPAAALFDEVREVLAGSDNQFANLYGGAHAAEVAWGGGRLDDASKMAVDALELARSAGSRHYEALALRVQGQILASQGSAAAASPVFDQAIGIFEETGSRLELGRAVYQRGLLRRRLGAANEAQAEMIRARAIFEDIGARRDRGRAEMALRPQAPASD